MRDTFGEALMAFHEGKKKPVVLRRDDGYRDEFDLQPLFSACHEWPEFEREALEHAKGRALDIGCGAGRHSLWLQEKGVDVVAIDISPLAVRVARARGVENAISMAAQELAFAPGPFDSVLLLGNNFGICGNITDTQRMMRQLYHLTSRDGRVITTCRDVTDPSKPEHIAYQELNGKRRRPVGQVTLRIEYKGEVGEWFDLLMVTPKEMEEICMPAGWITENIYKSENGLYAAVLMKEFSF